MGLSPFGRHVIFPRYRELSFHKNMKDIRNNVMFEILPKKNLINHRCLTFVIFILLKTLYVFTPNMSPSRDIEVDVSNIGMSVFILASRLVSKKLKQNGIYKIFLPDERYHTGLILIMLLLCVSTFFL